MQLPPVNGSPVYTKVQNKVIASRLGCMIAVNIWKQAIIYDELLINERQKKDGAFVKILDEVRRGCVSEESLDCLRSRVIDGTVVDKFVDLRKNGLSPICLFPTRKACNDFNNTMLSTLSTKLHRIACIDEIDETVSTKKWTKKAQKQLEMLSNMTAGLETELTIAIGARVMLQRNVDTKQGLVNGAIGTMTAISSNEVMVKFDHIDEPCQIQMVKGKFC